MLAVSVVDVPSLVDAATGERHCIVQLKMGLGGVADAGSDRVPVDQGGDITTN